MIFNKRVEVNDAIQLVYFHLRAELDSTYLSRSSGSVALSSKASQLTIPPAIGFYTGERVSYGMNALHDLALSVETSALAG